MASDSATILPVADIRNQLSLVERDASGTGSRPHQMSYINVHSSLFFDPNRSTAFLKLRLLAVPEDHLAVYLHIAPEQITNVFLDRTEMNNPETAQLCESSSRTTIALRFTLSTPGALVGPPEWPLPVGKVKQETLADIQFLAAQKSLAIHLPHGAINLSVARALCLAASRSGSLSSSSSHAHLARLYQGRGGKFIQLLDASTLDVESPAAPPPAYTNPAGPARPRSENDSQSGQSLKRQRVGSHNSAASTLSATPTPEPEAKPDSQASLTVVENERLRDQMRSYIEELCNESMAKREAEFRKEVFAELENIETRVKAAVVAHVEGLTADITAGVLDEVHGEMFEMVSRDEFEDAIDDKMTGIKIEMEAFVQDEMAEAHERVLGHLENSVFTSRLYRDYDE